MSCPPPAGEVANTRQKTSWEKKEKITKAPQLVKRVGQRTNKEKNTKGKYQADPSPKHPPGSDSSLWYEQYSHVLPASPPGTLLPRLSSPSCVRQLYPAPWHQTMRNEQSRFVIHPRHTTPSIRLIDKKINT